MALEKVNYVAHKTKITAKNMNDIQDAIIALEKAIQSGVVGTAGSTDRIIYVDVLAKSWIPHPDGIGHYQIVETGEIPALSMVTIQLTTEQVKIFKEKDLTFKTENHSGVLWITVVGQVPENDYVFQCKIEEVELQ